MHARDIVKLVAATLACAAILSIAVLWNEMPGSVVHCSDDEPTELSSDGSVKPYGIAHCFRIVPMAERIAKVAVSFFAFVALAYVVNKATPRSQIWTSAGLAMASAVIVLAVLGYLHGRVFERWLFPNLVALLVICAVTGSIGAGASWALSKWWPNKSLERTREE